MKNQTLMRNLSFILLLFTMNTFMMSCDSNPCDDGYTQVDGVCIPDYVLGIEQNFELGNRFYHPDLGIVKYENGVWYEEYNMAKININN